MWHEDQAATQGDERSAPRGWTRRSFMQAAGAVGMAGTVLPVLRGAESLSSAQARADSADRIVMLGVNGGPVLLPPHFQPALALVVSGHVYLIDCGGDAARQLTRAGLGFSGLGNVFLTHRHVDHTAGLPALRLLGWTYVPSPLTSLDVWGPPTTQSLVAEMEDAFQQEVSLFQTGFGAFSVAGHDLPYPVGDDQIHEVMEDDRVVVHLVSVYHGPEVPYAFAYRFTLKGSGKRIVFSGDTAAPNDNLIRLARDADVLVHEVMDYDAFEAQIQSYNLTPAQREAFLAHLQNSHSRVEDLPGVAKAARAGQLVMCHYAPAQEDVSTFLSKAQQAASDVGYTGAIIAPTELDSITL